MDFVCYDDTTVGQIRDFTQAIDDALYQKWRKMHPLKPRETETVAYGLTSVLFFGIICSLAEFGYNAKHVKRFQVNLALLVSKLDRYPISHFVYNGSRNGLSTIKNLVTRLKDTGIEPGTIIWDRGNVSNEYMNMIELSGWKLICGVHKTLKEAKNIIDSTDVPLNPATFVHKSRTGHIYAIRARDQLFDMERSVVVYTNQERRTSKINAQNEVLAYIGEELNALGEKGADWTEANLHKAIKTVVGSWGDYISTRVKRKRNGPRIEWKYKNQEIAAAERSHGKYLLFSTDESLSPDEVVKAYFEKDFVEKVFRTLKTSEEIEPVRHRLERRVRGYIFVCVLAYRMLADLKWRLQKISERKNVWHEADAFLHDLERAERIQVRLGHQVKIWHLNLTGKSRRTLEMMGFNEMLEETTEVDFKLQGEFKNCSDSRCNREGHRSRASKHLANRRFPQLLRRCGLLSLRSDQEPLTPETHRSIIPSPSDVSTDLGWNCTHPSEGCFAPLPHWCVSLFCRIRHPSAIYNSMLPAAACRIMRASRDVTRSSPLAARRSAIAASAEVRMPSELRSPLMPLTVVKLNSLLCAEFSR